MDSYRVPLDAAGAAARAGAQSRRASRGGSTAGVPARPVRIGRNVWIGFDACVLPGVTIGEGAVVGARSVVTRTCRRTPSSPATRRASIRRLDRTRRWRMAAEPGSRKGKIIVFGILFWYPLAGVTYQFLHYLLGLRRLGYDPYYVEDSGRWVYDPRINDLSPGRVGQRRGGRRRSSRRTASRTAGPSAATTRTAAATA